MLENNCQENTCNCPNWDNSRFSQIVKLSLFCSILSQGGWVFGPTEASFSVPWSIVPWYYVHLKSESRWCKWSWLNPVAGIICICRQLEIWKSVLYMCYILDRTTVGIDNLSWNWGPIEWENYYWMGGPSLHKGMSYLISLNPMLLENVAYIGSFKHFSEYVYAGLFQIWKIGRCGR